ncbi:MAG: PIN domain-containing protein [Nanoarchaeota archaeon]|nr:PIN domain-containing protein [Nanoarchaeota archaeon]MBU1103538.1 PIN domain-containing protein [Nanoarchaeota archaeon]
MTKFYYLDTSIWLDFFENRDEPNFPKGEWAKRLVDWIIKERGKIICSEVIRNEMIVVGYSKYEIEDWFFPLRRHLVFIYSDKKQFGRAKDLSKKRKIPLFDALHAIIVRDLKATRVTRDKHFDSLLDIVRYRKPEEII